MFLGDWCLHGYDCQFIGCLGSIQSSIYGSQQHAGGLQRQRAGTCNLHLHANYILENWYPFIVNIELY